MHTKLTVCVDFDSELVLLLGKVVNAGEMFTRSGRIFKLPKNRYYERLKSCLIFILHPPIREHAFTFKIIEHKVWFAVYDKFRFRI